RFFASKKITKEWALAEGYRVPRTYAITQDISSALTALETERFVLKPADDSGRGLFLMHGNLNLFDRHRYTKEAILDAVEEYRRTAGRSNAEFILEELIVQEGVHPAYPVV